MTSYKNVKAHILMGCALCIKAKLQKQYAVQKNLYDKAMESFKMYKLYRQIYWNVNQLI